MTSEADTRLPHISQVSVTWGLSFARHKWIALFGLALGPLLLKLAVAILFHQVALRREEMFVALVVRLAAEAWLICAAMMLTIETARGLRVSVPSLALRSLSYLPKLLLSFLCLALLFGAWPASKQFLSMMTVSLNLFLIWAPFFIVGELYAKEIPQEEEEEEDLYDGDEGMGSPARKTYLFSNKAIWHLGWLRSVDMTLAHLSMTLEFVTLLYCAMVVPSALGIFFFGAYPTLHAELFETTLSTLMFAGVFGLAAASFLTVLSRDAKDELSLPREATSVWFQRESQRDQRRKEVQGFVLMLFLVPLAVGGTMYTLHGLSKQRSAPQSAAINPKSVARDGESVNLVLDLRDEAHAFRWLEPEAFLLRVTSLGPPDAGDKKAVSEFRPERFYVIGENGEVLAERYRPQFHPLRVDLRYLIPGQLRSPSDVELVYAPTGATERVVFSTQFASITSTPSLPERSGDQPEPARGAGSALGEANK